MVIRNAFTLLELIVTIVVIGITFSIVPTLLDQENKMQDETNIQEAIYASSTKMAQILSYQWDENSTDITSGSTTGSLVLDTLGNPAFQRVGTSSYRIGHFQESGRRKLFNNVTNAGVVGKEGNITNDIDDLITLASTLINGENSAYGYKDDYTIDINTTYISDDLSAGTYNGSILAFDYDLTVSPNTTNLKHIKVRTLDSKGEELFTLHAISANVGESVIASRSF